MKQSSDPVRWSEQHDSALPDELIRGLKGYAEQGPSRGQRARMVERLALDIAAGAQPRVVGLTRAVVRWGMGALLLAGLGGLGALMWSTDSSTLEHEAHEAPITLEAKSVQPALPPPTPVASAPVQPAKEAAVAGEAPSGARRGRTGRAKPANADDVPPAFDPGAELRLLAPARQLVAAQPARALELAKEHARAFPRGVFAEERQVLVVEALARTGERAQAQGEAREFTKRYPHSTYLDRVAQALNEPAATR